MGNTIIGSNPVSSAMKNKLWLIVICLSIVFGGTAHANHGTLGHWNAKTIIVADLTGNPDWNLAIKHAVNQWNSEMDYVKLVLGAAASCDPVTERVIVFCETNDLPPGWLGDARHTFREDHIVHVQIAVRHGVWWKPAIACHELGHALGLWHRAQDSNSCLAPVMKSTTSPNPDEHDFKEVSKLHSHRHSDITI